MQDELLKNRVNWWLVRRKIIENLCWIQVLTADELEMCAKSGTLKYQESGANNRQETYGPGTNSNGPEWHIMGRIRELVVAKLLGLEWDPEIFYRRGAKDVGGMVEVRGTEKVEGKLFIKPFDKSKPRRSGDEGKGPMTLVEKMSGNTYYLAGWIDCDEALTPGRYARVGGEGTNTDLGIWVPQKDLNPMAELAAMVHKHCGQRG